MAASDPKRTLRSRAGPVMLSRGTGTGTSHAGEVRNLGRVTCSILAAVRCCHVLVLGIQILALLAKCAPCDLGGIGTSPTQRSQQHVGVLPIPFSLHSSGRTRPRTLAFGNASEQVALGAPWGLYPAVPFRPDRNSASLSVRTLRLSASGRNRTCPAPARITKLPSKNRGCTWISTRFDRF